MTRLLWALSPGGIIVDDRRDLFDRWLSTRIKSVQAQARSEAVPAFRVGRRPRRATRVLGSSLAVVLIVVVAAVALITHQGTGGQSAPPSSPGSVVPWLGLPAAQHPTSRTHRGIEACAASTLAVTATGEPFIGNGPANASSWMVVIRNVGNTVCFIGPTVDVAFITPGGRQRLPRLSNGDPSGDIIYLVPAGSTSAATEAVGDLNAGCMPLGTRLELSPGPTLGSITIDPGPPGGAGPPCANPKGPYWLFLTVCCYDGPIGRPAPQAQAVIDAPNTVHRGQRTHFLITVKNAPQNTTRPCCVTLPPLPTVTLKPCPVYQEELEGVAGTAVAYTLNCGQARPIGNDGTETFEMFITVPIGAHPGPAVLAWRFISPDNLANATAYIEIAP